MKKKLVIRTREYPVYSETFITQQAVIAINLGYDVFFLVNKKGKIGNSTQADLILKYDLLDRTYQLPELDLSSRFKKLGLIFKILILNPSVNNIKALNPFAHGKQALKGKLLFEYFRLGKLAKADIFHIQFGVNQQPVEQLKRAGLIKASIITTFHGYDVHHNAQTIDKRKNYYKYLFRTGSVFTANTPYLKHVVTELGCPPDKLKVVPMPINTSYFTPKNAAESNVINIISVGRLVAWKGHKYGIKAIAQLVNNGITKLRYTIVGHGQELNNLKALASELKVLDFVHFYGVANHEVLRELFVNANIFLMTSTFDETERRETQGVVTGEAQACGLPVVAFKSGGVPYTLQDGKTGFLAEENDFVTMAKHLKTLIENPSLRKEMGVNAREFVDQKFSVQHAMRSWKLIYEEALAC